MGADAPHSRRDPRRHGCPRACEVGVSSAEQRDRRAVASAQDLGNEVGAIQVQPGRLVQQPQQDGHT